MRMVKCPLCKGKGYLEIRKYKGRIECPMCAGLKTVWKLKGSDKVWVEELDYGYYLHQVGAVYRDADARIYESTIRDVIDKADEDKPVKFCDHCFGAYVIVDDTIWECYP